MTTTTTVQPTYRAPNEPVHAPNQMATIFLVCVTLAAFGLAARLLFGGRRGGNGHHRRR